jgi:hypothetical protein
VYVLTPETGLVGMVSFIAGGGDRIGTFAHGAQVSLKDIQGLAVDPTNNFLFVADSGNKVVRKMDVVSGHSIIFAGRVKKENFVLPSKPFENGETAYKVKFGNPSSVWVDGDGKVFIADSLFHTISVVRHDKIFLFAGKWQSGAISNTLMTGPANQVQIEASHIFGDSNIGVLYLSDGTRGGIQQISPLTVNVYAATPAPTFLATNIPTIAPTINEPSGVPTSQPSEMPNGQPSEQPTSQPTSRPSTSQPSGQPTGQPSEQPTSQPTSRPFSSQPSGQPTGQPSRQPMSQPSEQPTSQPTSRPFSSQPSGQPTGQPSRQPIGRPSGQPTGQPSGQPVSRPSGQPTGQPSRQPTSQPTSRPSTSLPSGHPTGQPSRQPIGRPSGQPTGQPSGQPVGRPSGQPTGQPSRQPMSRPSGQPSSQPTSKPSTRPTPVISAVSQLDVSVVVIPTGIWVDSNGYLYAAKGVFTGGLVWKVAQGILSAFAGDPVNMGLSGDGLLATQASIHTPAGLWGDTVNFYLCESAGFPRVRTVNFATNIITTIAGGGSNAVTTNDQSALTVTLSSPRSIWGDGNGNFYILTATQALVYSAGNIKILAYSSTGGDNDLLNLPLPGLMGQISGDVSRNCLYITELPSSTAPNTGAIVRRLNLMSKTATVFAGQYGQTSTVRMNTLDHTVCGWLRMGLFLFLTVALRPSLKLTQIQVQLLGSQALGMTEVSLVLLLRMTVAMH